MTRKVWPAAATRREIGLGLLATFCAGAARAGGPGAVDVRTFGAIGDGVVDDTAALLRAHQSGRALIYPKTSAYFRITHTLDVQAHVLGQGGEIRLRGDGKGSHPILRVKRNTSPVTISGLVLDGGYEGGTAGEWDHGVACLGARNVTIRGNVIRRPYGDCVYVGSDFETKSPCQDIVIDGNTLIDPRRCNVAVVSGLRVRISNNVILSKHGYVAAIDLEPDPNGADVIRDVSIIRNTVEAAAPCIRVTQGLHETTTGVIVRGNSAKGPGFIWISSSANAVGSVVQDNDFSATAQDGYFLRDQWPAKIIVAHNADNTSCTLPHYQSVRPQPTPGLTARDNKFCS